MPFEPLMKSTMPRKMPSNWLYTNPSQILATVMSVISVVFTSSSLLHAAHGGG